MKKIDLGRSKDSRSIMGRAFVELVIIVIGILIALTADDWWTDRQERAEELEILNALAQDVMATHASVQSTEEEVSLALTSLKQLSEGSGGATANLEDAELVELLVYGLWEIPNMAVQMSAYDEIRDSGRLRLLVESELRRSLAEYDRSLSAALVLYNDVFSNQQLKLDPYLIENAQLSQFSERALRRDDSISDLDTIGMVVDHRLLLDDPTFQNQVAAKYYILNTYRLNVNELLGVLGALIPQIDSRIAQIH